MERWSAKEVCERSDKAFARFSNALNLWQAIAEIFYPERANFTSQMTPGEEVYLNIFDGEPIILRRDLANQLGAMLRRGEWFRCKAYPDALNQSDAVKKWSESATETQRNVIYAPRTNFSAAFQESDNDYVAFGTSVLQHSYNTRKTGLLFTCLHLRDCAWYENGDGDVDEFYQRMKLSLGEIKAMGLKIPDKLKNIAEKDLHHEIEVRRCVIPVDRFEHGKGTPRGAKYAVCYVAPSEQEDLVPADAPKPYFRTWPYLVRRWMKVSGEAFGRSPCTGVALADSRMLNQAQLSIIEGLERAVDPPMMAPDDAVGDGGVNVRPGGITFYDPELDYKGRRPIDVIESGRPDWGMEFSADRRLFLARAFLQNQIKLPAIDGQKMTATEINERIIEFTRSAAPIFEPMEAENAQLMDGVFERIRDADGPANPWGGFEEPPEELLGAEVRFEFETPLTEAKRKLLSEQARVANAYIAERVQLNPGIVDLIDQDEMDRAALEGIGPAKWLRNREDVEADRAEKAQAQEMTAAANLALSLATGGGKNAPQLPPPDPVSAALAQ